MNGAAARFAEVLLERALKRSLAPDGKLDQDEELRFVEALDLCWEVMTDEERRQAEQRFATAKGPDSSVAGSK